MAFGFETNNESWVIKAKKEISKTFYHLSFNLSISMDNFCWSEPLEK